MYRLPRPHFDNSGVLSRKGQFSNPGRDWTLRTWPKSTHLGLVSGFELPGWGAFWVFRPESPVEV